MLVTKLKNSRKFAVILILAVLFTCSCVMVSSYPAFAEAMEQEHEGLNEDLAMDIVDGLMTGNYYLYNELYSDVDQGYFAEANGNAADTFFLLRKYMDYEMFDYSGEARLNISDEATQKKLVKESNTYALHVSFLFSEDAGLKEVEVSGTALDGAQQYALEQRIYENYRDYIYQSVPEAVKIIYGITQENLEKYINDTQDDYLEWLNATTLSNKEIYLTFETVLVLLVMAFALLIPVNKGWRVTEYSIFRAPFEFVLLVWMCAIGLEAWYAKVVWNSIEHNLADIAEKVGIYGTNGYGIEGLLNILMWFCVFAIAYWGTTCLREIFTMKKEYWTKRCLCVKLVRRICAESEQYGDKVKTGAEDAAGIVRTGWERFRGFLHRIYDGLIHLDFQDQSNKTILGIVIVNFAVLLVVCCLWFYGIFALFIYSVVLFFFLRKYFRDIQEKYQLLLVSTNQLAEGNLDAPIDGDLGIFNPIKTEIQKIQKGFKKAVEEEVKSERMKTELITNVSHDLKTPLTAIITYVDLLKNEQDPQKQKEYLDVLERKSLRLKVLIEDLFEISKATSKNVTMNFMNVDIVDLLKQVGFEYDSKIQDANLEFRWKLPEKKLVLYLDSQKTYRIFENLIVNITKYAMPHTRVYIDMVETYNHVSISMKNVSASELNFNTDEITDRFVRGDSSRNTEGSGLGLAIAKSFTELQQGTLKVSTEADLFKVEICFPKKKEEKKEEAGGNFYEI